MQDTLTKKHNLVNKVWLEQIAKQTQQKKILEGILNERKK